MALRLSKSVACPIKRGAESIPVYGVRPVVRHAPRFGGLAQSAEGEQDRSASSSMGALLDVCMRKRNLCTRHPAHHSLLQHLAAAAVLLLFTRTPGAAASSINQLSLSTFLTPQPTPASAAFLPAA
jgi:hypothetical protein